MSQGLRYGFSSACDHGTHGVILINSSSVCTVTCTDNMNDKAVYDYVHTFTMRMCMCMCMCMCACMCMCIRLYAVHACACACAHAQGELSATVPYVWRMYAQACPTLSATGLRCIGVRGTALRVDLRATTLRYGFTWLLKRFYFMFTPSRGCFSAEISVRVRPSRLKGRYRVGVPRLRAA